MTRSDPAPGSTTGPPGGFPGGARSPGPTRRELLAASAALAAWPTLRPRDDQSAPARRPNVLFVLSDSHRALSTGCYGDTQVRTPHFDAFAAQGVRLTSAVSNTPVCRPYRASLMSGTWAHRHGMLLNTSPRNFGVDGRRQWNPGELPLLGEAFRAAGYRCNYIGKWHLGSARLDPGPLRFGFDDAWAVGVNPVHDYREWTYCTGSGDDQRVSGSGPFRAAMEVDLLFERLDAQRAEGPERPWFSVLSWGPPHDPLEPPEDFVWPADRALELPPSVQSEQASAYARAELPGYLGLIEAIDHEFGRLLAALEARGLADDTLVVYTSDHGNMMGSHDYLGKEMPHHPSSGVPFLARWPGRIPAGSVRGVPFGAPDVFPTLLGLCGLQRPAGIDGRDLSRSLLGDPDAPEPAAAYLAGYELPTLAWPGWRGLRTSRYLYARRQDKPWMLHDLIEDPWQQRDLRKDRKELRQELDALLSETMGEVGDSWG